MAVSPVQWPPPAEEMGEAGLTVALAVCRHAVRILTMVTVPGSEPGAGVAACLSTIRPLLKADQAFQTLGAGGPAPATRPVLASAAAMASLVLGRLIEGAVADAVARDAAVAACIGGTARLRRDGNTACIRAVDNRALLWPPPAGSGSRGTLGALMTPLRAATAWLHERIQASPVYADSFTGLHAAFRAVIDAEETFQALLRPRRTLAAAAFVPIAPRLAGAAAFARIAWGLFVQLAEIDAARRDAAAAALSADEAWRSSEGHIIAAPVNAAHAAV